MKKKFLICLTLMALFSSMLFAQRSGNSSVVVMYPVCQNITTSEQNWLPGSIQDRFESNFSKYTNYALINSANEKEIRYLQKKYEGSFYDEKTSVEQGKLTGARYALFTTVRKVGKYYTISAKFTDLQSGQNLASVTEQEISSVEKLCAVGGCTVDVLTLNILTQLKVSLSASQKYELQFGNENLSYDEQLANARQEELEFKNQITKYDAQIQTLKKSQSVESTSEIARLNAQKAIAEEKMKSAKLQSERLSEEKQRELQDQKNDLARTLNQKENRDKLIEKVNQRSEEIRRLKTENETLYAQVTILETKKKALSEIRKELNQRLDEIEKAALREYSAKRLEILNGPYRNAELVDGKPTSDALERRRNEVESERQRIENATKIQVTGLQSQVLSETAPLINEISSDKKRLATNKKSSSLSEDLTISFGGYNAERQAWTVYVYFYFGGNLIYKTTVELKYSQLLGKAVDVAKASNAEYHAYMDNVDLYSSLFARGEPIVFGIMSYSIDVDRDNPEKYIFNFKNLSLYDVLTGKKIASPELADKKSSFTFVPDSKYSLLNRPTFHIVSDEEIEKHKMTAQKKAEKKAATEIRKQKVDDTVDDFTSYLDRSSRYAFDFTTSVNSLTGYNLGVGIEESVGVDIPFWKNLFAGGELGWLMTSEKDFNLYNVVILMAEVGASFVCSSKDLLEFKGVTIPLDFYTSFGFGFCAGDYDDFLFRASFGFSWFMLKFEYNYTYLIFNEQSLHSFGLGVGFYANYNKNHKKRH